MRTIFILAALLAATPAAAGFANCGNLKGISVNQDPDGAVYHTPDKFLGATWTFNWGQGPLGQAIIRPMSVTPDQPTLVRPVTVQYGVDFVALIDIYPNDVRVYTLYPAAQKMLYSRQAANPGVPGSVSGSFMVGSCEIQP